MHSDEARFWDERFRNEGAIWGEEGSVTAQAALRFLPPTGRVLEIGFGYGRDLAFLIRRGYRVSGMDISAEGRVQAEARLRREGLAAERLETARFEPGGVPDETFDAVLSHRMVHLLVTDEGVENFVAAVHRALRPGGILCLGVRNPDDLHPDEMRQVSDNVYEYKQRPGHLIRYWNNENLRSAFGAFTFLALEPLCEIESNQHPVPCQLTFMVGKKSFGVETNSPSIPSVAHLALT